MSNHLTRSICASSESSSASSSLQACTWSSARAYAAPKPSTVIAPASHCHGARHFRPRSANLREGFALRHALENLGSELRRINMLVFGDRRSQRVNPLTAERFSGGAMCAPRLFRWDSGGILGGRYVLAQAWRAFWRAASSAGDTGGAPNGVSSLGANVIGGIDHDAFYHPSTLTSPDSPAGSAWMSPEIWPPRSISIWP